jgi:hypothetical protein
VAAVTESPPSSNQLVCPYCKRLITLPTILVGSKETCPHCEIEFVVASRMIRHESEHSGDPTEGYGLKSNIPVHATGTKLASDTPILEEETAVDEAKHSWRPMQAPPMGLFLNGTFTFPFQIKSHVCFLVLAAGAFMILEIAYQAWYCGGFSKSAAYLILSMVFTGLSFVLFMIWYFVMSGYCLSILRDTSEGIDEHKGMASDVFLDMFAESVYMITSIFWSALPGGIIVLSLPGLWSNRPLVIVPLAMILYPLILLSLMENQSVAAPFSKPVWRSLWYAWHSWVLFYLLTLLVGETVVYLLRLMPFIDYFIEIVVISLLLPYFLMVYFRLLGRLALYCSGHYDEMQSRYKYRDM